MTDLSGKTIAILSTHGYEFSELDEPKKRLAAAGAKVLVVSPEEGPIKGWQGPNWHGETEVDMSLDDAEVADFDALVLPGGQINPDILRATPKAVRLVKGFYYAKKPIAAICHAPWLLVEAEIARGRKMTSYHSVRKDVENAGAEWVDESVACDQGIITSRNPDDLDAFCDKIIEEVAKGVHSDRQVEAA